MLAAKDKVGIMMSCASVVFLGRLPFKVKQTYRPGQFLDISKGPDTNLLTTEESCIMTCNIFCGQRQAFSICIENPVGMAKLSWIFIKVSRVFLVNS